MLPARLPFCPYPSATDGAALLPLPDTLPLWTPERALPYRNPVRRVAAASELTPEQQESLVRTIAESFALRDPMVRYLQLPVHPPPGLDPSFGPWTKSNLFHWLIRLFFLTGPEALAQSLAILDDAGEVLGGAINEPLSHGDAPPPSGPFHDAVLGFFLPVMEFLGEQEAAAVGALAAGYPEFREALHHGKVGRHALVARGDSLPVEETFELVASTAEHYHRLGYSYIVSAAVNQWTGAAFTVLGGVPLHFAPFMDRSRVAHSSVPLDVVSSPSGFLADKDSGSMAFLLRLR